MKAKEWLQSGLDRKNPIDAFTDIWRGFNNLFYPMRGSTERNKIKNILDSNISQELAKKIILKYKTEIDYLVSTPVIDMRNNGRDTQIYINDYSNSRNTLAKLQAILMIIYQVRCNLEHGQKSPSRERDIKLCNCSYPIVAEIMTLIIE